MSKAATTETASEYGVKFPDGKIIWSGQPASNPDVAQLVNWDSQNWSLRGGNHSWYETHNQAWPDLIARWRYNLAKNGIVLDEEATTPVIVKHDIVTITMEAEVIS
jgi:hypothetical protein